MDGLALLCNLHADGPLTLRRLRGAGIRTLDQLIDAEHGSITGLLRASPSHGRRFQREAAALRERIQESALEPELPRPSSVPGELAAPFVRARRPQAFDLAPPAPVVPAPVPVVEAIVEAVAPAPIERRIPAESAAVPEPEVEERPLATADAPLRAGEIVGLDARRCERLVREGVRTYRALVDLAGLSLARRAEIPYTHLLDLRHHARALLARRRVPAAPATRDVAPEDATPAAPAEPAEGERVVVLRPTARRAPTGSLHRARVDEGARAEPRATVVREEPGVAGPFV